MILKLDLGSNSFYRAKAFNFYTFIQECNNKDDFIDIYFFDRRRLSHEIMENPLGVKEIYDRIVRKCDYYNVDLFNYPFIILRDNYDSYGALRNNFQLIFFTVINNKSCFLIDKDLKIKNRNSMDTKSRLVHLCTFNISGSIQFNLLSIKPLFKIFNDKGFIEDSIHEELYDIIRYYTYPASRINDFELDKPYCIRVIQDFSYYD